MFGYGLLGAGWLILKTEGAVQDGRPPPGPRLPRSACWSAIGVVSLWTPLISPAIADRWFSWPNIALLAPVPIATALAALLHLARARRHAPRSAPFIGAIAAVRALLPRHRDQPVADDRAATTSRCGRRRPRRSTQAFLLVGTLFLLPVILMYTGWSYWVFRGKVRADIGYH